MRSIILTVILSLVPLTLLIPSSARAQQPQLSVSGVVKAAKNSVVFIVVSDESGTPLKQGSGFVASDGEIVTNHHVISGAGSATVKLTDGTILPVLGVLGDDEKQDIAIIKVSGHTPKPLLLAKSASLSVGDHVVAIGSPKGLENTVSDGIISAFREEPDARWLQTSVPITHGSSGGPLLTMNCKVAGITTMGLSEGNLNFAAPADEIAVMLAAADSSSVKPFPPAPKPEHIETPKQVIPDKPELNWLNSKRYDTSTFSASFPFPKIGDPDVSYSTVNLSEGISHVYEEDTEGGAVRTVISYTDLNFRPDKSILALDRILAATISGGGLNNPIQGETSYANIHQDQSFDSTQAIIARESTARGEYNGKALRLCVRVGIQGNRMWSLMALVDDSTGHTKKEVDAFFDSIIVK